MDLKKLFENLEVKYEENMKPGNCDITISFKTKDKDDCNCKYNQCSCDRHYEDIDEDLKEKIDNLESLYDEDNEYYEPEPIVKELNYEGESTPIYVENAVNTDFLYDDKWSAEDFDENESDNYVEPKVKHINVNKNVSEALETIYDVITEQNRDDEDEAYFDLEKDFPELFENVDSKEMEIVMSRIQDHLIENGFDVETKYLNNEHDGLVEVSYIVWVKW